MPLAKMPTLFGRMDLFDNQSVPLDLPEIDFKEPTSEEKYAVRPPFNGMAEVYVWTEFLSKEPGWQVKVQVGNPRVAGNTGVDFLNPLRMITLHLDGVYWHEKASARDAIVRAALVGQGFRTVAFRYTDLEDAMLRFPRFYQEYLQ
jgi:hypothetical protein